MPNSTPRSRDTSVRPEEEAATIPRTDRVSLGLMSLVAGGVGLLLVSIPHLRVLTVPFCLIGLFMGILEFWYHDQADRHLGRASAGAGICLLVLFVAGIRYLFADNGGQVARIQAPSGAPPSGAPQSSAAQGNVAQSDVPLIMPFPCGKRLRLAPIKAEKAGEPVEWVDASSAAVQQGEVAVCVASAIVQPLELTSGGETSRSPDDHLVIRLQVLLIGTTGKVEFESWGNVNFGGIKHKPLLTDNLGNTYQARALAPATEVVGYDRDPSLYPKLFADDLIVFEVPHADVEFLRLELPASAFGGVGMLRFQIPRSMVEMQGKAQSSDSPPSDSAESPK